MSGEEEILLMKVYHEPWKEFSEKNIRICYGEAQQNVWIFKLQGSFEQIKNVPNKKVSSKRYFPLQKLSFTLTRYRFQQHETIAISFSIYAEKV